MKSSPSPKKSSPLFQRGFRGLKINPTIHHIPYNPDLKEKARNLRNNMTVAEKKIWHELLSKDQLHGFRFLRQKPIDCYIADFYCSALMLVIEIDGDSHFREEVQENDIERSKIFSSFGIDVIRYTNDQILNHFSNVVDDLESKVEMRLRFVEGER